MGIVEGPDGRYDGIPLVGSKVGTEVITAVLLIVGLGEGYRVKSFVLTVLWEVAHATLIVTVPLLGITTFAELLPGIIRKLLHIPFTKLPPET